MPFDRSLLSKEISIISSGGAGGGGIRWNLRLPILPKKNNPRRPLLQQVRKHGCARSMVFRVIQKLRSTSLACFRASPHHLSRRLRASGSRLNCDSGYGAELVLSLGFLDLRQLHYVVSDVAPAGRACMKKLIPLKFRPDPGGR